MTTMPPTAAPAQTAYALTPETPTDLQVGVVIDTAAYELQVVADPRQLRLPAEQTLADLLNGEGLIHLAPVHPGSWLVIGHGPIDPVLGPQATQLRALEDAAEQLDIEGSGVSARAYVATGIDLHWICRSAALNAARQALTAAGADGDWWAGAGGCQRGFEIIALAARDLIGSVPGWDRAAYALLTRPWHATTGRALHPDDDLADVHRDPADINWTARQAVAAIPYEVVDGRPVNPCERIGRRGRGGLWHWGERLAADALVTAADPTGARWILLVERGDGHGWAAPGGMVDPGETPLHAAIRELGEETGLDLPGNVFCWVIGDPCYVPDPRGTDEAWMVTIPHTVNLGALNTLPPVTGGDDAARAAWIPATSYQALTSHLADTYGGTVFAAHTDLVRRHLRQRPPAAPACPPWCGQDHHQTEWGHWRQISLADGITVALTQLPVPGDQPELLIGTDPTQAGGGWVHRHPVPTHADALSLAHMLAALNARPDVTNAVRQLAELAR